MNFNEWLRDTKTLTEKSITKYVNAVKVTSDEMIERRVISKDIFLMDHNEFDLYFTKILKDEQFLTKDNRGHHMYSVALQHYKDYLMFVYENNNSFNTLIVPEIRVLPMVEFNDYDSCVHFLTSTMKNRGNTFFYKKRSIVAPKNSLILFQFKGEIIGCALLDFDEAISEDHKLYSEGRKGFYKFINNSVKIINNPISNKEMQNSFNIKLSQASTKMDISMLQQLLMRLFFCDIYHNEEIKSVNVCCDTKALTIEFKNIIDHSICDNTYKMIWAKALIELVDNSEKEKCIKFEQIAEVFFKHYWNQTIFYGIEKSRKTGKTPQIVNEIVELIEKYKRLHQQDNIPFYSNVIDIIKKQLNKEYIACLKQIAKIIKKDVCWRFKVIKGKSLDCLYKLDLDNDIVIVPPSTIQMLIQNKKSFLDSINERIEQLLK